MSGSCLYIIAPVAQWIERFASDEEAGGPNPSRRTASNAAPQGDVFVSESCSIASNATNHV
jgi:hypothetical protein